MEIKANNPNIKTWLNVSKDSDFPIQNIPFGVFISKDDIITVGTRIGDYAIDLSALHQLGYFEGIELPEDIFLQDTLNDFISLGKPSWRVLRNRISDIFNFENKNLKDNDKHKKQVLFKIEEVEMLLPVDIGDYTDFYSSKEHATNVGIMFRGKENALMPNWVHIPVGYHGRCSSIVVSGSKIHRPKGQILLEGENKPIFDSSRRVDFELETGFITTEANPLGKNITTEEAENYIFGMVLLNDWSARDIQKWEYVPLGPFLSKSFATTISPWIVTLDALAPFKTKNPIQNPKPLPYLEQSENKSYDINLEVSIQPKDVDEVTVSRTNFKYMYWTMAQQLAHHTIGGCNVRAGDLMGSGTISGSTSDSYGSMLELAWKGTKPIEMIDGSTRVFINDFDTVIFRGYSKNKNIRIGFGSCKGQILPSINKSHIL